MANVFPASSQPDFAETGQVQLPEVVLHQTAPEVAHDSRHIFPEVVYNKTYSPDVSAPAFASRDYYPEVALEGHDVNRSSPTDPEGGSKEMTAEKPRGFVWSSKWIISLAVAAVVIIAGVVGGVVGSKTRSSESGSASSDTGGTGTSGTGTTSGSSTATPTSVANGMPAVVAAVATSNGKTPSIQVLYQTDDSTDIHYTTYRSGGSSTFNPTYKLEAKTALSLKMPMTVLSKYDDDNNVLATLFHISSSETSTDISKIEFSCPKSDDICSETSSGVITGNVTNKVHSQSGVAAVWLDGETNGGSRVYYQAVDGSIVELNRDGEAKAEWKEATTGGVAAFGSRIAATGAVGPKVLVFYADSDNGLPTELVYDGGWGKPTHMTTASPDGWNATSDIAACYVPTPDTFRFYFTSPSTGNIFEYKRSTSATRWTKLAHEFSPSKLNSGVAAVGWLDQVRLYYTSGGKLQQSLLGNGTWKGTFSIG